MGRLLSRIVACMLAGLLGLQVAACDEKIVEVVPAAQVQIEQDAVTVEPGDTLTLNARVVDERDNVLGGRDVQWQSSEPGVVTIDAGGVARAQTVGTATIRAIHGEARDSVQVTVSPATVATVTVSPPAPTLLRDQAIELEAVARDKFDNVLSGRTVTWSAADTTIARVSEDGVVTGRRPGTVAVVATIGGESAQADVTVSPQMISANWQHTCALDAAGSAWCWGANDAGQLGNGSTDDSAQPVAVSAAGLRFTEIAAGGDHTCALVDDGSVRCWGGNFTGQLGDGGNSDRSTPVEVLLPGGVSATAVVAGDAHACALTTAGTIYCWGGNYYGQLGDGSDVPSNIPVQVSSAIAFVAISARSGHTCALTAEGDGYCWGRGTEGQLGDGMELDATTPQPVSMPDGIDFSRIDAGFGHTCALTRGGTAYCWGWNDAAQIGDNSTTPRPTPVLVSGGRVFRSLTVGGFHTCGVTTGDALYCWGANWSGQFGDGTVQGTQVPAPAASLPVHVAAAGDDHTCALATAGGVRCWGHRGRGKLGDGTTASALQPAAIAGSYTAITAGAESHTCAVTAAGAPHCWGLNVDGQLGNGSTVTASTTPVAVTVPAGLTFDQVDAGATHSCARTVGGDVYCWGVNWAGQLGDGTTAQRVSAVRVNAPAGVSLTRLSVGGLHSCAIDANDVLYCWGYNGSGQIGDGTLDEAHSPVAIGGALRFDAVAAGGSHTCAVTTSGEVRCWGYNAEGQLGDGSTNDAASPVIADLGGATAVDVSAGDVHSCARDVSGNAYCWGANYDGQVGDGTTEPRLSPVAVTGGRVFNSLFAGANHTCGIDGTSLFCWGSNEKGAFGDGGRTSSSQPVPAADGLALIDAAAGTDYGCGIDAGQTAYCWGRRWYGVIGDGSSAFALLPEIVTGLP